MVNAVPSRDLACYSAFIEPRLRKRDGEPVERPPGPSRCECGDHGRVDATRKKECNRHVTDEVAVDRPLEGFADELHRGRAVRNEILLRVRLHERYGRDLLERRAGGVE